MANPTPAWIEQRILNFFNYADTVEDLLDGTVQDDPTDGPGTTMGPTLAARILRQRRELPWNRFTSLEQIDAVRGVGAGMLKDFAYSFGQPAADEFRAALYEEGIIYPSNWKLAYHRYTIGRDAEWSVLANDNEALRQLVLEELSKLVAVRQIPEEDWERMEAEIKTAYVDRYSNSTDEAALVLALWFYRFDADNWFAYDDMLEACQDYFIHHMGGRDWQMDLLMLKGVRLSGFVENGIAPADLPVVVNHPERSVTIWFSSLLD